MHLKIDTSKAYNCISWRYLAVVMRRMGFGAHLIDMIMFCVTTVQYYISANGELVGPIFHGRGLRQGDSLSPYHLCKWPICLTKGVRGAG